MKKLVLILTLIVFAAPLTADAGSHKHHNERHISVSDHSSFGIEDGELPQSAYPNEDGAEVEAVGFGSDVRCTGYMQVGWYIPPWNNWIVAVDVDHAVIVTTVKVGSVEECCEIHRATRRHSATRW